MRNGVMKRTEETPLLSAPCDIQFQYVPLGEQETILTAQTFVPWQFWQKSLTFL